MSCEQYWTDKGFTDCARGEVFGFTSLFAVGSLIWTLHYVFTSKSTGSIKLPPSGESEPLLATNSQPQLGFDSIGGESNNSNSHSTDSVSHSHFDIKHAKLVDDHGKSLGHTKLVYRDFSEKTKVALEAFLLILQVVLSIAPFFSEELSDEFSGYSIALVLNFASWFYLLAVSTLRVFSASTGLSDKFPDLWYHSFTLYLLNLTTSSCLFLSVLLGGIQSYTVSLFYKINFALTFLIFLVSGLQKLGDKPALLYVLEGSPSGLASVSNFFQIISYSYIDPMIFKAHKTPLKYEEIWTLEANDHSYPVVLDFHKKPANVRITRRLLDQFKWDFAAQFGFSVISSSLVFVPTICLKKILEFIENPDLISIRSAWLYAFLMFASGVISASFRGRCLFIGRRVSVHTSRNKR
ncbi:unnamed protein product [Ambrosiozyma monospora]|uniref:Unnamed protein product n=1 Tax=Ambrosiozyma monospora TaxID=43982 RepID=A0A9W7DHU9_AMBMO|nr:unnamed protein product [Ambrosiozyma monospora]